MIDNAINRLSDFIEILWKGGFLLAACVYVYFQVDNHEDRLTALEKNEDETRAVDSTCRSNVALNKQKIGSVEKRIDGCSDDHISLHNDVERLKDQMYKLHGFGQ